MSSLHRLAQRALLFAPGTALILLALHNGGFFPIATAVTAIATLAILLLWATLMPHPGAGFSRGAAIAAGALAAFAAWTLASSQWSDAPARAILEYDRVLLYLGAFVLFALLGRTGARARLMVGGLAVATTLVCVGALGVWLLPETFPTDPASFERYRLSWPTSYWNATGLLAGLATVFALHFSSSLDEPRWVRAAAAAVIPLTVATLWFTVSRGAAGATAGLGVASAVRRARSATARACCCRFESAHPTAVSRVRARGADTLVDLLEPRSLDDGRRTPERC